MTDFVADLRAPTPSAAAELITPTRATLTTELETQFQRLRRALDQELRYQHSLLAGLNRRLKDPAATLTQQMLRVDELEARLARSWQHSAASQSARLAAAAKSLSLLAPAKRIGRERQRLAATHRDLGRAVASRLSEHRLALAGKARALAAVSPLNTLSRGYAVLLADSDGERRPVTSVTAADPGDQLAAVLTDGTLELEVTGRSGDSPFANLDPELDAD